MNPAAFCPKHGIVPAPMNLSGQNITVSFVGCKSKCPYCGIATEVVPGTYETIPGGLRFLADKSISREALQALVRIAEQVRDDEITPEKAIVEAHRFSHEFGEVFKNFLKFGAWTLPLLISLLTLKIAYTDSQSSTEFQAEVLKTMQQQTSILERIADSKSLEEDQLLDENKHGLDHHATPKPKPKPPESVRLTRKKPDRIAQAQKSRRIARLKYHLSFSPKLFR